jgi:hypothetical protein
LHPRLLTRRLGYPLAAGLLTLACGGDPDHALDIEHAAIVNGEPSDESEDQVVEILTRSVADTCSATLIAPDVLVTALHCVAQRDNPDGRFTCNADGTLDPDEPGAGSIGLPVDGEEVSVYSGPGPDAEVVAVGVRVFGTGAMQICRGDLAVVVLDREVGTQSNSVRFGRSVVRGEALLSIGYGQTADGFRMGRNRREVSVLDVGDVGDVPGTGLTPPDTFIVGSGPCYGDSGGPALSQETGALVGVYSLTHSLNCTSSTVSNTYTLVSQFEDTIREAMEFAGREIVLEDGSGGSSGSGSGGSAGTAGSAGTNPGEGSGSRDDATCGCRTVGVRAHGAFDFGALVIALFAAARRARRSARA